MSVHAAVLIEMTRLFGGRYQFGLYCKCPVLSDGHPHRHIIRTK